MRNVQINEVALSIVRFFVCGYGNENAFHSTGRSCGDGVFIGISMLLSGVSEIALYFNDEPEKRSAWMLAEGMLATLLGIWAVFGRGAAVLVAVLPFLFAVWVMTSGILRIAGAFSMKASDSEKACMLFLGILNAVLGFVLLFSPYFSAAVAAYAIAFMFIAYGIHSIYIFFVLKKI